MKFIDLQKQYNKIKDNIDNDIKSILNRTDFVLGKKVFNLEKKLADYVGISECITCASGTDALLIPLMAENLKKNDAVFTTNFSFFATAEVISLVGATPVFVDIDKKTFNIDPQLLEKKIIEVVNKGTFKPKAIIAVDLFGQLADYRKIEKIAKKYNLFLIEDAAQSFGSSYKNKKSCSFGDVAATSFYPAKPLGCYGDGGAIFTNDKKKAEIYRSIRVHGQGEDKYDNVRVGINSRLDTLQAAILLSKLSIFNEEIEKRNKIATYYKKHLKNIVEVPFVSNNNISSWAQFSVLAESDKHRNEFIKYLESKNIPTAIFYKKLFSELEIYKNLEKSSFDISRNISSRIFSLPMHPYLDSKQLEMIVQTMKEF
ncbi:MAG: aminotransferase DegT [Candidatus Marinimicrobia bacterium]|nr:aminotransferase DegT [Candidatus Neomarinimicrobiota bacterium]|tara:strand:- start:16310 stop:17422 length:1113 start_codon:yes stop_codon:yes gene_type:complete